MPIRTQMSRKRGWRKPADTSYVGRPTAWGNPWRVGGKAHGAIDPATAVARYEKSLLDGSLLDGHGTPLIDRIDELRGHDLACWCGLDQPCHADVLLRVANR
jgi:hypothetical protein